MVYQLRHRSLRVIRMPRTDVVISLFRVDSHKVCKYIPELPVLPVARSIPCSLCIWCLAVFVDMCVCAHVYMCGCALCTVTLCTVRCAPVRLLRSIFAFTANPVHGVTVRYVRLLFASPHS